MLPSLDGFVQAKNVEYRLIPSRDMAKQRILLADWLRAFQVTNEEPDFSQTCSFTRIIKNIVMIHFWGRKDNSMDCFWQKQKRNILK